MIKKLALILLAIATVAMATTLTGTMQTPDGTGASGYLYLSLSQQAALITGSCGGPIQVVPTYEVKITVTGGTVSGTIYGNDCLIPAGTYYNVRFTDTRGNTQMTDRWVITGSSVDVGTIVSVIVSGTTQTLGGNGVLVSTSATNQTVTQSSGTKFSVNLLAATTTWTMPDTGFCNASGCVFQNTAAFVSGIGTTAASSSTLFVGSGNFYNRYYTGTLASCVGVTDGWTAIKKDTHELEICLGGAMYFATLTAK